MHRWYYSGQSTRKTWQLWPLPITAKLQLSQMYHECFHHTSTAGYFFMYTHWICMVNVSRYFWTSCFSFLSKKVHILFGFTRKKYFSYQLLNKQIGNWIYGSFLDRSKWKISIRGPSFPNWRADRKALDFISEVGRHIMLVEQSLQWLLCCTSPLR